MEWFLFFFGIGTLIYTICNFHIWLNSEKVTAKIVNADAKYIPGTTGRGYEVHYIYEINIDDKVIKLRGPMLFHTFFWKRKLGKKVSVRYNRELNKVALDISSILGYAFFSILLIFFGEYVLVLID